MSPRQEVRRSTPLPGRCLISSRSQANKINLRKINCLWILNILLRFKSSSSSGRYCDSLVSETAHCDDQSLEKNESSDLRSLSLHLDYQLHTNSYIDHVRESLSSLLIFPFDNNCDELEED